MQKGNISIEYVKQLGKNKSEDAFNELLNLFGTIKEIDIKREIVSSIGRQNNIDKIVEFIAKEGFNNNPMELIYQMYRTCLYKGKLDKRLQDLGEKIRYTYNNENIEKMKAYYDYRQKKIARKRNKFINRPLLLIGDSEETLKQIPENSIQLVFTSPQYYNAKEYSNYSSYNDIVDTLSKQNCEQLKENGIKYLVLKGNDNILDNFIVILKNLDIPHHQTI